MQENNVLEQEVQTEKVKVIGKLKPKSKFIEFIGGKGNIQFLANEANIEAKYLSGLDMDGVTFKLTICDEGTVDLDEVLNDGETEKTTLEQRQRLLDVICDKTIGFLNKKTVVSDLVFRSVNKFKGKEVDLYLSVEYQTPISKLASIFDDDVDVSDDQQSKLDDLLSLFDEEESLAETIFQSETQEELIREFEGESDEVKSDYQKSMEESFKKMKEEKMTELKNRLQQQEDELKRFNYEKAQSEKKIEDAKSEIKVLESRIDSLQPNVDPNGYYFSVSEQLNEKVILDESTAKIIFDKVSKVKSINAEAFMKLFEQGEYQIRLGYKSLDTLVEITEYDSLPDDAKEYLTKLGTFVTDGKLIYNGELKWHDLVGKMIKGGFSQDPEFDKMCGSNSYSVSK